MAAIAHRHLARNKTLFLTLVFSAFVWLKVPATESQPAIREFNFWIKLKSTKINTTETIPGGTVLVAFGSDPEELYQPIALCKPLEVTFDSMGESGPVEVSGFCFLPGVPLPPANSTFRIVDWSFEELWAHGCDDRDVLEKVRNKYKKRDPANDPTSRKFVCPEANLGDCLSYFNRLKPIAELSECQSEADCLSKLDALGECDISIDHRSFMRSYVAYCHASLW